MVEAVQLGTVLVLVVVGVADVSIAMAWTRTDAGACRSAAFNAQKGVALMVASVVVNKGSQRRMKETRKQTKRMNRGRPRCICTKLFKIQVSSLHLVTGVPT
jgi:hypothetical protein